MAITLLQMAEKVLEDEKRVMTAWEIWQIAENKGYDKLVASQANTPFVPLEALVYSDTRENPSSRFVFLGERPKKFILKTQLEKIQPGSRIRVLEHFNDVVDDFTHITEVFATKNSIGVILSYEEYSAHTDHLYDSDREQRSRIKSPLLRDLMDDTHIRHLEWVKSEMMAGRHFPGRIERFVPLPEIDLARLKRDFEIVDIRCHEGVVTILPTYTFVVEE